MYETTTTYPEMTTQDTATIVAAGFGFFMFMLFVSVLAYVISAFFLGKIFKKAGEPAWAAWVPIYNSWKMLEMGGQQGFWAILVVVPILNIVALVFYIMALYQIGLKFGKEGVFVLLAIFLPFVWIIWLALDDKAVWQGGEPTAPVAVPPSTPTA